jgi:PAS domain S-box-containing protein
VKKILLQSTAPPVSVDDPLIQTSLLGEAVEHGPLAVFVVDDERRYVAVSTAACTLLGYTRGELLALRVADVVPDVEAQALVPPDAGTVSGTAVVTCKDGSTRRLSYLAGTTEVAGMTVYVSVCAPT